MEKNIFEKIDELEPNELENYGVITVANNSEKVNGYPTYICPQCGNGSHGAKSMGLTVKKFDWGYNYWCHRCGNFTATKLLEQKLGSLTNVVEWYKNNFHFFPFNGTIKKIALEEKTYGTEKTAEYHKTNFFPFNGNLEKFGRKEVAEKNFLNEQSEKNFPTKNYAELYRSAKLGLKKFFKKYKSWRGLEIEDLEKVGAGIATAEELKKCDEKVPSECFIFPFNENHFFMRSVEENLKRGNTGGSKEIYDLLVEKNCREIIAVEGIIDCLSIYKATKLSVVAVDGAGRFKNLLEWKQKFFPSSTVKFILIGDNNDNGAGQEGVATGIKNLHDAGVHAVSKILSPDKKYDANEFLQIEGVEKLSERIFEIVKEAKEEFERLELERKIKNKPSLLSMVEIRREGYGIARAKLLKYYSGLKTNLKSLDRKQIFSSGIYLLGGVTGIGKTTFALQLAENFARQGQIILYISYEQTAELLQAKILSRRLKIESSEEKSDMEIYLDGELQEKIFSLLNDDETFERINFYEGENENVTDLIELVQEKFLREGKKPIIFLDYVQKIPAMRKMEGTKEKLDSSMKILKDFQKKNDLIIFALSSFNRENYWLPVSETAFKETGELEFTADVILGLQYSVLNDFGKIKTEFEKRNAIGQAKKQRPREIQLVCLKNRFGETYGCNLLYHSTVNNFEEISRKSKSQTDWETK